MNKEKALEITRDRLENLHSFTPENESESKIAKETMEYLKYIEDLLKGE